jgi:hypothetical protein
MELDDTSSPPNKKKDQPPADDAQDPGILADVYQIVGKLNNPNSSTEGDFTVLQRLDSLWDEYLRDKEQDRYDRQQERELKGKYADAFLEIAKWQLVGVFCAIACSGVKLMEFNPTELPIIIAGTLAEVFGIVYVIAKSLFDKNNKTMLDEEPSRGIKKIKEFSELGKSIISAK